MSPKEGEGVYLGMDDGCPTHKTEYLYRKFIDGLWRELCSAQNCYYCDIVRKERRQRQPIQFADRRKNAI